LAVKAVYCLTMLTTRLDLARIRAARRDIDRIFLDTPLYQCDALGRELGCTVSILSSQGDARLGR
jgi:threonine dehydratase